MPVQRQPGRGAAERPIAVRLAAPIVLVNANRVTGNELIQITGATAKSATVLGNITTRGSFWPAPAAGAPGCPESRA